MSQPITDYAAFLDEAQSAVRALEKNREELLQLEIEKKRLDKSLESERKAVTDAISITVKKRIEEINSSYDKEIQKGQERLKRARGKREKAKNQGIKERIEDETEELRSENRELRLRIKTLFQSEHVPAFCNSKLYYALYFPRSISEALIFLAALVICYLAVPWGIYLLLKKPDTIYLIGIYFAVVVVFGGLYLLVNNMTKVRHRDPLKQGRILRNVMLSNDKKIRVIISSIKRDRNESVYDLEKYDDEIAKIQQELEETSHKKKEALNTFDTVTKTILADEITSSSQERIEKIQDEKRELEMRLENMRAGVREQTFDVSGRYETYLGKEYMHPDKLARLKEIIESGQASNLTEAIAVCNENGV